MNPRVSSSCFVRALNHIDEPLSFIEIVARSLGEKGALVRQWAEKIGQANLAEEIHRRISGGCSDEWEFLYSCRMEERCQDLDETDSPSSSRSYRGCSSNPAGAVEKSPGLSRGETEAPRYISGEENRAFLEEVLSYLFPALAVGTRRMIIIEGPPMSGKSLLLEKIRSAVTSAISVPVLQYRDRVQGGASQGDYPALICIDDLDMELTSQESERLMIRLYRSSRHVILGTCRQRPRGDLVTSCDIQFLKIPEPSEETAVRILSEIPVKGYMIQSDQALRIVRMVRSLGSQTPLKTMLDIKYDLLCRHIMDDLRSGVQESSRSIRPSKTDLERSFKKITGITVQVATTGMRRTLKNQLLERIFGQEAVLDSVLPYLVSIRSGLTDPSGPAGVFLFFGPTGSGKTELSRVLADILYEGRFHKEDMNTYSEQHTVSRLTGAPPGYTGYTDVPAIMDFLDRNNRGVIVLDEIEKAHPNVLDHIMEALDTGEIRDARGKVHSTRNMLFILCSNLTYSAETQSPIGFETVQGSVSLISPREKIIATGHFKPEFLGRVQHVSEFAELAEEDRHRLAVHLLEKLGERLRLAGIAPLSTRSRNEMAREACERSDLSQGGRGIRSYIETHIKPVLMRRANKEAEQNGTE